MTGIWLAAFVALWLVVGFLMFSMFIIARQVGMLHTRLGPTGARMTNDGLTVGETAPTLNAEDLSGQPLTVGGQRSNPQLILFITTACTTCAALTPSIRALWKSESDKLDLLLVALYSTEEAAREFVRRYRVRDIPCTVSQIVGFDYKVSAPPFGILLDEQGMVRAKGIINNNEHLESLLNVVELGQVSVEGWYRDQRQTRKSALARDTATVQ